MKLYRATTIFLLIFLFLSPLETYSEGNIPYQTISQVREQAASGWHQTYQAYGRTIVVDIPIQVPEADNIPALKAEPMHAFDGIPITDWHGYNQGNEKFFNEVGFFRWDSPAGEVRTEAARADRKEDPPKGMDERPIVRYLNQLEWDTAYAYNNPTTLREADTLIKTTWDKYFPKEKILLVPHWVHAYGEMRFYDSNTDTYSGDPWPDFQGPMMVYFDQVIRGIPLLCYSMNSFSHYTGPVQQETRGFIGGIAIIQGQKDIGLDDMSYSMQYSLLKEQQEIEADVPLCRLDQVINTYEQQIADGKLRSVQSLRLGYVVWYNKGEPESFTLLPTWVLEGELFRGSNEERHNPVTQSTVIPSEYGPILVNAQTGELIDPWNSSPDRSFDKPDILPWK
jgi:hypothetical protein